MIPKKRLFEEQFISADMSSLVQELTDLLHRHCATIEFEAETVNGQGSMITLKKQGEVMSITVESPYAVDVDADLLGQSLKQVMIF